MKPNFYANIALTALTAAPSFAQVSYIVTGELPDSEGKAVYMQDYDPDNEMIIDSTTVTNGRFRFEGDYVRDAFVRIESGRQFSNCVLDSLVSVDFDTHYAKEGISAKNNLVIQINKLFDAFYAKGDSLYQSEIAKGTPKEEIGKIYQKFSHAEFPALNEKITKGVIEQPNGAGEYMMRKIVSNMQLTPDEWDAIYSTLSPRIKELGFTKRTDKRMQNIRKTMPGKPFVDFAGKTPDGKDVKLSDLVGKGKYVLVDFWASWCGPCRKEAKEVLKPLYEKYRNLDNFEILGVAVWDKPEATLKALETAGYDWPQMIGCDKVPMELYGFNAIPEIMLFNPDGTIAARGLIRDRLVTTVENAILNNRNQ